MYGIEAINHHNGWAMAAAGALIVMFGLSVLSFVISQLHKVVAIIESWTKKRPQPVETKVETDTARPRFLLDIDELRKLAFIQNNGSSGKNISNVCRYLLGEDVPHPKKKDRIDTGRIKA